MTAAASPYILRSFTAIPSNIARFGRTRERDEGKRKWGGKERDLRNMLWTKPILST